MKKIDLGKRGVIRGAVGAIALPLFGVGFGTRVRASDYPSKTVKLIVPFPAGGTTDIVARILGERLAGLLGQSFAIENIDGAGGNLGSTVAAKALADGYTLLLGTVSTHAINKYLYKKLPFDPVTSFAPVSLVVTVPNVLIVSAASPYKTAKDLLAAAKERPGGLEMGSAGNGTSLHLSGVLVSRMTGVPYRHVPYRGSGPVLSGLSDGEIDYAFDNLPSALPFIRSGKLRALAVTSSKPSPLLPEVPTIASALGLRNFDTSSWFALFAPAGTPARIVSQLSQTVSIAVKDRATSSQLSSAGCVVIGSTPEQLEKHMQFELPMWSALVLASGAKLD